MSRSRNYRPSLRKTRTSLLISSSIAALLAMMCTNTAVARIIEEGEVLTTFDPYGDSEGELISESDALDDLIPKLMMSLSYGYTYRTGFDGHNIVWATEQMHMWTAGVHYSPWPFLFVGAAVPTAVSKFDGVQRSLLIEEGQDGFDVDNTEPMPRYDWTGGFGDIVTYVGSELPWIPLTLTGLVMWPTGDIEKGMGTGEFSFGITADLSFRFGKVSTKLGGFYFYLRNPTVKLVTESSDGSTTTETDVVLNLPDSFGASVSASVPVSKLRLGVGFKWSRRTLITWDTVHVLEPSARVIWPVTPWFATVLNTSVEVYPVFALVPTLTMVWSI